MSETLNLTEGKIMPRLWAFYTPILASSLFQQLYNTVDSIIVGQLCGKLGLASIDATGAMTRLPVAFFSGIAAGIAILISQQFGAGHSQELSRTEHTGVALSFLCGIAFSLLGVLLAPQLTRIMAVPDNIWDDALAYLAIYLGGMCFMLIYNTGAGILRAVGNTKVPFRILILAGIANVVLDYLFVGPLQLGVAGAALATVLAEGISAVLVLRALFTANSVIRLSRRDIRIDREALHQILHLGVPTSLQSSLYPIANIIIQTATNTLGSDVIAAWGMVSKLDLILWLCMNSLGPTISTFTAQNYGAKKIDRIRQGTRYMITFGVCLIGFLSIILYLFTEPLSKLFLDPDSYGIIPLVRQYMNTQAPFYFTFVFGNVLSGTIQGSGETVMPMFITLLGTCLLRIAWIFFYLPQHPGMISICYCFPVSWIVTSALYLLYYFGWHLKHRLLNQAA